MRKGMNSRLGIRIAVFVDSFLLVAVIAGIALLYWQDTRRVHARQTEYGRLLSMIGAESISTVIEEAIDNKILSIEDFFDTNYEIIEGFNPPKYHTRYDAYFDKAVLKLQDEFLESPSVLYAVASDANGYVPTHNTRYQQPVTGNEQKDREGNRTKRIFTDDSTENAVKNLEKGFVQRVPDAHRKRVLEISSPIYVKGRYWGFFKIGMAASTANTASIQMLKQLLMGGVVFLLLSSVIIFGIVNNFLQPLAEFAKRASDLADGDVDQKIEFRRKDEIGQVADALERLRISLQAAIERLMRR